MDNFESMVKVIPESESTEIFNIVSTLILLDPTLPYCLNPYLTLISTATQFPTLNPLVRTP